MPSPTLLDFALIDKQLDYFCAELSVDRHIALQALALHFYLDLDQIQIENAITDGRNDCGIDGIYIDEDVSQPTIYIYQSKLLQNKEKRDSSFPQNAIDKLCLAVDNYILKPIPEVVPGYINPQLVQKIKDVRATLSDFPKIKLLFINNGTEANQDSKQKLDIWINEKNKGSELFSYAFLDASALINLIAPDQVRVINANIKLSGEYADWQGRSGVRTVIGRVAAIDLAELRKKEGMNLFDKNIRGYLGQSNKKPINQKILASAVGSNAHHFFILNNGLTVVCKRIKYMTVPESPILQLSDLQIVNGGQTTNSIYEAFEQGLDLRNTFILAKFIETDDEELLSEITEATNSQTPVTARDLRSNDRVQQKIEADMKLQGYYYESRLDKWKNADVPKDRRIDAVAAAQAFFAYQLGKPVEAKNQKRLMFTEYYDQIFDEGNYELSKQLLESFLMYRRVHSQQKFYRGKYTFYPHAELTLLALLKFTSADSSWDDTAFDLVLKKILSATNRVVQEDTKKLGIEYNHRQLFISKDTLSRLKTELKFK